MWSTYPSPKKTPTTQHLISFDRQTWDNGSIRVDAKNEKIIGQNCDKTHSLTSLSDWGVPGGEERYEKESSFILDDVNNPVCIHQTSTDLCVTTIAVLQIQGRAGKNCPMKKGGTALRANEIDASTWSEHGFMVSVHVGFGWCCIVVLMPAVQLCLRLVGIAAMVSSAFSWPLHGGMLWQRALVQD